MLPMSPKELTKFAAIASPFWQVPVFISIFYGNGTIQDTTDLVLPVALSLLYSLCGTVIFAHHVRNEGVSHERGRIFSALPEHLREEVLKHLEKRR